MKKILLSMFLVASVMLSFGQGLQNVLVEQIPVPASAIAEDANLNANSKTYRVFIQMAPDYKLNRVFGEFQNPMVFQTTTQFYNNADEGLVIPTFAASKIPTMADALFYDSWLTIGQYGRSTAASQLIPMAEDINDGVQDGRILGAVTNATALDPATTFDVYLGSEMGGTLDFGTAGWNPENVLWYAAGGQAGTGASNSICIGQFTTDGDFSFTIGVSMSPLVGAAELYVPSSYLPTGAYTQSNLLSFTTVNVAPTVSLTAPTAGATYFAGDIVNMAATAADTDGTIAKVEFLVDGVKVGEDLTAPFEYAWNSTLGTKSITARAIDNGGKATTSDAVVVIVNAVPLNALPTAAVTAPANGASYDVKDVPTATINIVATGADTDGTVAKIEFFVNGSKVGEDLTSPYEYTYTQTVVGSYAITAVATDNLGAAGPASAAVNVTVFNSGVSFQLGNQPVDSVVCHSSSVFCVPVKRINTGVTNATGFDFELEYDAALVTPTGAVIVSNDMTNERQTGTYFRQEGTNKIYVGVFFVDGTSTFNGTGNILCVEFARNIDFVTGARAEIELTSIITSYSDANAVVENLPAPYTYTTYNNTVFEGSLSFWADNSPIGGVSPWATTTVRSMTNAHSTVVDASGKFFYDINLGGDNFRIEKLNPAAPSTWDSVALTKQVWSSYDGLLTQKVIVNDPSFIPNVFQIIAMDVNRDGVVTAGDITQILRRSVETINDFTQVSGPRKWDFLSTEALNAELRYRISNTYPANDGVGYSKNNVPKVSANFVVEDGVNPGCAIMESENFKGILLGDVDGSWARVTPNGTIKSDVVTGDMVQLDLATATMEENYINIPVRLFASEPVHDMDVVLSYNGSELFFESVVSHSDAIIMEANNINNQHLSIASIDNSNPYPVEEKLFTLRFYAVGGFEMENITNVAAFIRGVEVATEITTFTAPEVTAVENFDLMLKIYPNPATEMLKVELPEAAQIQLISIEGKVLYTNLDANGVEVIDVKGLASGVYMLRVSNDKVSIVRQVVIK